MNEQNRPPMVVPPTYYQSTPLPPTMPQAPVEVEGDGGRNLVEYFNILLKRKKWIIGTFLIIFLAVAVYTFLRTPIFLSVATLQITQDNPGSQVSLDDKLSQLTGTDSLEKFQQTQYKILHSESLAERVIKALNLQEHEDFKKIREKHPDKSDTEINNLMVTEFLDRLGVNPVRNTFLVQVSFQSSDKAMAQQVVNTIADEYMNLSIDRRNESFALVRKWLDKQLQEMALKVQEAQKKLYAFGQQTDIYTLDDKDNVVVQKFLDLSSLLTKAQAERLAKEAQFKQIREKGPDAPFIVNHPLVAKLREQAVAQQAKVSALLKIYRRDHPELQAEQANLLELRQRLQTEVQRLQESVKADYEAAIRTEKLLTESFNYQKGQMAKLQDSLTDYQILKRDAHTNEQLFQALLARVKEANIAGTMVPSNVAVIDPGRLPDRPYKPRKMRDLGLAAVVGLVFGVGLALLVEQLDDSIKSVDDLERATGLPSLGMVPLLAANGAQTAKGWKSLPASVLEKLPWRRSNGRPRPENTSMNLIVYQQPQSAVSEAIGQVYSSIMLSTSGRPPAVIMITSPNPGEGKSTIAANLAQSYALHEQGTLIMDCDLRKPTLHKKFGLSAQPGLTNFLTGGAKLEEIIRPTAVPNLSIITAGLRPPKPANLLNSDNFRELLEVLRQRFSHIVIDTPPVLGFADARFISVLVDGVLLVTRYNATDKGAGRLAHQFLMQAPIIGAVLNGVDHYGHSYGYYHYKYKYYYKYYHSDQS